MKRWFVARFAALGLRFKALFEARGIGGTGRLSEARTAWLGTYGGGSLSCMKGCGISRDHYILVG